MIIGKILKQKTILLMVVKLKNYSLTITSIKTIFPKLGNCATLAKKVTLLKVSSLSL
jgi:hypothetical protein